jgi:protein O-mannosyl-transferase
MRAPAAVMPQPGLPAWLIAALLALVTIAIYWPATRCGFVNFDDTEYLTANVHVQRGLTLESMKWACVNPVCCNWHPLTVWSHMAVSQVFGLNPWGHHLANVLLHAINAGLVFALLQQMTGTRWRSLLVAALFALHPLRVESVAWVSERKDVLSAFFGLLALIAYSRYVEVQSLKSKVQSPKSVVRGLSPIFHLPSPIFYLLSLFFFALGLMSKPMLVTWPFVILLLDYWPLGRMRNAECRMQNAEASETQHATRNTPHVSRITLLSLLVEKIPFFVLAGLVSVVTFVVQQRGGSLVAAESLPFGVRIGNALVSYVRYLGKLFWPMDLAVYYPHPGHWSFGKLGPTVGLILGISALVWVARRRYPYLLIGWLWFVGMLVPVIGLVQTGEQALADRHTYLPSLGVLILAIWGAYELSLRWRHHVTAWWVVGCAAIILCLTSTRQQIGYWKDGETLFRRALELTENNALAHNNLGDALGKKGQTDEAIREYQEAIHLKPDLAEAHNNLGVALGRKGQIDEAIRQLQEAIRLRPDDALAHNNLGAAFYQRGRTGEAILHFREAVRLKPDYADTHNGLGIALDKTGQIDEAIRQFQEAIRLDPDHTDAHYNLGVAFHQQGRTTEAIREFQEAVRLKPDRAEAHNNLGTALGMSGQTDEAIHQFQEALRLKPDYADARRNLNLLLGTRGQPPSPPGGATNR